MKPLQFQVVGALLAGLMTAAGVAADDGELRLMNESVAFTNVIDAFDDDDAFDLNAHVGFSRSRYAATIQREINDMSAAAGRGTANLLNIGEYEHVRNVLDLGVDIGIYRDLMLFVRLPLVLSDARNIASPAGGVDLANNELRELDPTPGLMGTPQLYYMPFESRTRSGIDRLDLGFAFNVLNQARRPSFPTWMMLFETSLGIGALMQPCDANDMQRDEAGNVTGPARACDPGVSTGTHAFKYETRLSRRYRYAEVYSGLGYTFQWAGRAIDSFTGAPPNTTFAGAGTLAGFKNERPPMLGTLTGGATLIPWEQRARWQRLTIDLRATVTYVSEGRDYSPLYDALGSSQHQYLSLPAKEGVPQDFNGDMREDQTLREVYFNGLTDVQAHGVIGGQFSIAMQAAQYIRFRFGTKLTYTTPHFLTMADACNASVDPSGTNDPRQGRCIQGIINPHHRSVVDLPGKRFRVGGGLTWNIFVNATAQF